MSIYGVRTDYVLVNLNNNGCAFVQIEGRRFETSREIGECWVREARNAGYEEKFYCRMENGDHRYVFN